MCSFSIPNSLSKYLGKLGKLCGNHPLTFISLSILIALFFGTGLQRIDYTVDNEQLFVPHGSIGLQERATVESFFPMNYSDYVKGHETRYLSQVAIIIEPKNMSEDGLFSHNGLLDLGLKIDDHVQYQRNTPWTQNSETSP